MSEVFDAVVIGGGPAGATAAWDLAGLGRQVALLDRAGRVKPCGGAVPPQLLLDFDVPRSMLVNTVNSARMVSPKGRGVEMPIENGYVGMVDRDVFDDWLRVRAAARGATRLTGRYTHVTRNGDGTLLVHFSEGRGREGALRTLRTRMVIGADGALSQVAKQEIPGAEGMKRVFAYHEIVASPPESADFVNARCDVFYQGRLSPDFYAWIFPHGATTSIGTGSFQQGFGMREAVAQLRRDTGLDKVETLRREGAPIPLEPLRRWDNGRDIVLAGDAAGVVAPASGEGIFYAMTGGRVAAQAVHEALDTGDARALAHARKQFMKSHGQVFRVLGMMQHFWYANDARRERFVAICNDPDVQRLTFQGYMHKKLVRAKPMAHLRIFFKNVAHLTGLAAA
ncbi:MAG TPA: geranylgeranyl diphosphate reductase [Gemmatimonadales bacterium]|nr:geranylgeranyl diphosphate reductase [Gemmatimonadales bacterium]